ncbi:MAG: energy-coupling factor ABC transporter ATP-binding protein [Bacilli bacterium]|nr:energy-coupling factor ABC transporter ATP-binding protein [Bacilli bacterium]MBP3635452.1 energy-coupling factor ABC transporter ATP-binding protein [Bacilli bacterium]
MSYISIKNLNFGYDKKRIFNDININIEKGSLVALTSSNSSGKTSLLNIIYGNIITERTIFINNVELNQNNVENFQRKVTFFTPCIKFYSKTVLDELLLELGADNIINKNKIKKILQEFNMIKYIDKSPLCLSYIETQKLNLVKAILKKSEILLIDNIFSYFDKYSKIEFIGLIKKYQIDNGLTVVYATNDLNDIVFCDKVIMINSAHVLYDGPVDKIYLNEKLLKESKINIPVLNELMDKLKLYDIINENVCTINEMVDEICK